MTNLRKTLTQSIAAGYLILGGITGLANYANAQENTSSNQSWELGWQKKLCTKSSLKENIDDVIAGLKKKTGKEWEKTAVEGLIDNYNETGKVSDRTCTIVPQLDGSVTWKENLSQPEEKPKAAPDFNKGKDIKYDGARPAREPAKAKSDDHTPASSAVYVRPEVKVQDNNERCSAEFDKIKRHIEGNSQRTDKHFWGYVLGRLSDIQPTMSSNSEFGELYGRAWDLSNVSSDYMRLSKKLNRDIIEGRNDGNKRYWNGKLGEMNRLKPASRTFSGFGELYDKVQARAMGKQPREASGSLVQAPGANAVEASAPAEGPAPAAPASPATPAQGRPETDPSLRRSSTESPRYSQRGLVFGEGMETSDAGLLYPLMVGYKHNRWTGAVGGWKTKFKPSACENNACSSDIISDINALGFQRRAINTRDFDGELTRMIFEARYDVHNRWNVAARATWDMITESWKGQDAIRTLRYGNPVAFDQRQVSGEESFNRYSLGVGAGFHFTPSWSLQGRINFPLNGGENSHKHQYGEVSGGASVNYTWDFNK